MPIHIGAERDLRFLYCAGKNADETKFFAVLLNVDICVNRNCLLLVLPAAICFMLNNWNGMDREKAKEYILKCQVRFIEVLLFDSICVFTMYLTVAISKGISGNVYSQ